MMNYYSNDMRRIQIVIQGFRLTKEFYTEENIAEKVFRTDECRITDWMAAPTTEVSKKFLLGS